MNEEEFSQLLSVGYELHGVEYKGAAPRTDNYLFAQVTKAALGMSNTRDGGLIIVGVSDHNGVLNPVGLNAQDLHTWLYDDIAAGFAEYADPSINFDRETINYQGKTFILLRIKEFTEIPVICKKNFSFNRDKNNPNSKAEDILRKGACYVRPWRKPETTEIPTLEDMRSLIELSVEKGVKKFISQTHAAGINITDIAKLQSSELYKDQIEYTNPLLTKIKSTGFWEVIIRPVSFIKNRIPDIRMLYPIIANAMVQRSKYFPHMGLNDKVNIGSDWIGYGEDIGWHIEDWRFYQSGLFINTFAIRDDLTLDNGPKKWKPGEILDVSEVLYHLTEIFLFAAHLAGSDTFKNESIIHIEINLNGIQDRRLVNLDHNFHIYQLRAPRIATIGIYTFSDDIAKEDVLSTPEELATRVAADLFYRFGLNINLEILKNMQVHQR